MDPETLIIALRKNAVLVVMHVVLGALVGLGFGLLTPALAVDARLAEVLRLPGLPLMGLGVVLVAACAMRSDSRAPR